jgi:hypothetical protein
MLFSGLRFEDILLEVKMKPLIQNIEVTFLRQLNFLHRIMIKLQSSCLENTHKISKYTSHAIQNEILQVLASKVRNKIHEDIEDFKFCIIVDEVWDM